MDRQLIEVIVIDELVDRFLEGKQYVLAESQQNMINELAESLVATLIERSNLFAGDPEEAKRMRQQLIDQGSTPEEADETIADMTGDVSGTTLGKDIDKAAGKKPKKQAQAPKDETPGQLDAEEKAEASDAKSDLMKTLKQKGIVGAAAQGVGKVANKVFTALFGQGVFQRREDAEQMIKQVQDTGQTPAEAAKMLYRSMYRFQQGGEGGGPGQTGPAPGPSPDPEPEGDGSGAGSEFAVPVFKKFSGADQEKGAPQRSLSSQLMKLFPNVPKSAITQILKGVASQLKTSDITVQETQLNEKKPSRAKRKQGKKDLSQAYRQGKAMVKKLKAGEWQAQRADGDKKSFHQLAYNNSIKKAKEAAEAWAKGDQPEDPTVVLHNKFKSMLKRLDLETSEGREAAKNTDAAYLGAYKFYKAMKLAYDAIKTDRLDTRSDRIEKLLKPLNEKQGENENAAGKDLKTWLGNMINIFDEAGLNDRERGMRTSKAARGASDPKEKGYSPADVKSSAGVVNTRQSVGPQLKAAGINLKSPEGQALQKKMLKVIRRFLGKNMQRMGKQDIKIVSEKLIKELQNRGIIQ